MVAILWSFICPNCIGSWPLYLESLCDMQAYLAAAEHNNYTKSLGLLFISKILDFRYSRPDAHVAFMNDFFPL